MKNIGLARFPAKGPMEYLMSNGEWISDADLYSGAPVLLFEGNDTALLHAQQFPKKVRPCCVEFEVDRNGRILAG